MKTEEMLQFLSLSRLSALRYSPDQDDLRIFRITEQGGEMILYQGSLSAWAEKAEMALNPKYEGSFLSFLEDLRSGKYSFCHSFEMSGVLYAANCCFKDGIVYGAIQSEKLLEDKTHLLFRREADRDPMLDMLNKRAITEYARMRMDPSKKEVTYLVMLDLDNFKPVNDTFGHPFGDKILVTCTDIINKAMGSYGVAGRIGGDEILIVTNGLADKPDLRPFLKMIRINVEMAFKGKLNGISLTCSMGAAAYPTHGSTFDSVLELADKMLYLAKDKGRNRYIIYTPEMHRDIVLENRQNAARSDNVVMTYNKTEIMHFLLSEFLIHQRCSNQFAFTQVGNAFKLNEVLCIYNEGLVGFHWTATGEPKLGDEEFSLVAPNQDFYSYFDRNGLFIMDALYDLDEKDAELQQRLHDRHVESAIFYRLKQKGKPSGYMLFAKYFQRQKWSEYEILALATVAKIFELSIQDNP